MNTVVIKSNSKGISLILDDSVDFDELVLEICRTFARSKKFFQNREVILSIEGRRLTPEQTLVVIDAITLNCDISIPYILDDSELTDVRMIGLSDRFFYEELAGNAKVIRGNVSSGEVIESEYGILVIGDVKKRGKIIAKGSVTVLGKLDGEVRAGEPNDPKAFIAAGKLHAKRATIGGVTNDVSIKYRGLRTAKIQGEPIVVRLLHGVFHAEPLSSGLIKQDE